MRFLTDVYCRQDRSIAEVHPPSINADDILNVDYRKSRREIINKKKRSSDYHQMAATKDVLISNNEREFVLSGFKEGIRCDGRGSNDYRRLKILFGNQPGQGKQEQERIGRKCKFEEDSRQRHLVV